MTGDSHNNDEPNVNDEDFIVEDIGGETDELADLLGAPMKFEEEPAAANANKDDENDEDDEDDLLFSDHTENSEQPDLFSKPTFDESAESDWDGDQLDLESVGVPDLDLDGEEESADPQITKAKESFAAELDAMLSDEDEFALDVAEASDVVDIAGAVDDGIAEFMESGAFVLEDDDEVWAEELEAVVGDAGDEAQIQDQVEGEEDFVVIDDDEGSFFAAVDQALDDTIDEAETIVSESPLTVDSEDEDLAGMPLLEAASSDLDDAEDVVGWEPLPSTCMDALSEVDEVQRVYDEGETQEGAGPNFEVVEHQHHVGEISEHDIYAETDGRESHGVVLGGIGSRRGPMLSLIASLAASLLIVVGAAAIIVRPAWFGLRIDPERVDKVELRRPKIEVLVSEPPMVAYPPAPVTNTDTSDGSAVKAVTPTVVPVSGPENSRPETEKPADAADNEVLQPSDTKPALEVVKPEPVIPSETVVKAVDSQPVTEEPQVLVAPVAIAKANPAGEGAVSVGSTINDQGDAGSSSQDGSPQWPRTSANSSTPEGLVVKDAPLTRFGEGLLVGSSNRSPATNTQIINGVMPGSRAFAQLHNGNYFIGKVKHVAAEAITLRVETGEVTLSKVDIAQLKRLGSSDYDRLQQATKGFVRLRNNNRLIGGILSEIADDHVVLQFRSNRVILPKSAVGEIVPGSSDGGHVRLGTTTEEEDWLKQLSERQLGNGQEASAKPEAVRVPPRSGPPR
jgi:hypothetical protein